ncbi:MAG: hypothetical protein O6761_06800 [Thaumarchaeota archaeon]|nr:hypothetical protein [Nitrososphaerota archaeon]
MKLVEARKISLDLLSELGKHFEILQVVGSIRRQCETVHDIDFVGIRKPDSSYQFGEVSLEYHIIVLDLTGYSESRKDERLDISRFADGHAIKRFQYKGITVEIYLADESTFECLKLIRTGSTEHNIRLTKLARAKDMKLFASGKGLCKIKGGIYNNEPEEIIEVVENTEDGILMNLLGRVPKPEDRRN